MESTQEEKLNEFKREYFADLCHRYQDPMNRITEERLRHTAPICNITPAQVGQFLSVGKVERKKLIAHETARHTINNYVLWASFLMSAISIFLLMDNYRAVFTVIFMIISFLVIVFTQYIVEGRWIDRDYSDSN